MLKQIAIPPKHPVRGYLTEYEWEKMVNAPYGEAKYYRELNAIREKEMKTRKPQRPQQQ